MVACNAAFSDIGPFLRSSPESHQSVIDVNVRGPMICAHHFGRRMEDRGRGGIILMTSLTAFLMGRVLSRKVAVTIMGNATRRLYL